MKHDRPDDRYSEVERLLREYRQNQDMVRGIGTHFYQIIYPVQLRHHEKMGISTREIGAPKFPQRGYGEGTGYPGPPRGRVRTGKHFHRTSLLIKAFNHKFRLDLELNTQLLAPNLVQKHYLPNGAEQVSKQEIEHCYYHGTVKDYPGATAAFHTCNGVSGVIHVGNETFVIHPFYGGDLSQKHPHVIFEARTKTNKGCANSGNFEWRMNSFRRQKHISGMAEGTKANASGSRYRRSVQIGPKFRWTLRKGARVRRDVKEGSRNLRDRGEYARYRRDVRDVIKFIETALVIDKAMFEKRNGSSRMDVVHDAIQVANIADLYFRTLNTRVSVVYIETWQGTNQAPVEKNQDIIRSLLNFNDYTSRKLYKVDKDTTQLLTGEVFQGGETGMAVPETVCTTKSVGINVDINTYEPHLLAGTMAHMIGHNIGMGHDDGREECFCRDWHGCIMARSIVGLENVQPYKFSECSRSDYVDALRIGHGICLMNKPNELVMRRTCGNSIVEEGEDCDCGTIDECHDKDPCCDPITCKLTTEAECASGPCCSDCKLRPRGVICRDAVNECDLPEHCSGEDGNCPVDIYKKNGNPCGGNTGYCFNGICPTVNIQCGVVWGYGGIAGDKQCFDQFNSKGSINGHCGIDDNGQYIKCDPENVRCGSLQCKLGNRYPLNGKDQLYSTTIISIKGEEYECKHATSRSTGGTKDSSGNRDMGLVRDGTPCGDNLICVNQTCTSIFPHIDQGKCPSNHNNLECSGHGVCSNVNKCYCEMGWSGPDCSIQIEMTLPPEHTTARSADMQTTKEGTKVTKKETPYESYHSTNTVFLVGMLMLVVGGVFIVFALMALCYRSVVVHKNFSLCLRRKSTVPKYDSPYVKKPMPKKYPGKGPNHNPEEAAMESVNKILTFGSMPSYSRGDSQRVLFRPVNHMTAGSLNTRFQEHKMQQLKRMGVGSGSEEDATHSGEEETVSFIDLPPNNLSKLPEKGILKKSGPYGTVMGDACKEKWSEDSQSDNQEILSQSDNNLGPDMMGGGGGAISEVERTLKSLNGYHEDILEALRNAASHRGAAMPSSSSSLLSEEILRKSLAECSSGGSYSDYKRSGSQEKVCDGPQTHTVLVEGTGSLLHHHGAQQEEDDDDEVPPSCGPIRIRNLEDLIRQLEHHSARHMSPSGSEDIRMSETEADRHYRLESAACSESQSRCRGREEEPRFVYGRYRHPTGRHPPGYHHHHLQEEEGIYETADHDRGGDQLCGDTPDSESDEFIQAQQQLVRSASEEALPVTAKHRSSSYERGGVVHHTRHHSHHRASPRQQQQDKPSMASTSSVVSGGGAVKREYYPSPPPSESEDESSPDSPSPSSSAAPAMTSAAGSQSTEHLRRSASEDSVDEDNDSSRETAASSSVSGTEQTALLRPKRYPEYKH
ncbi:disintegrin and metalloproteinase domain-containing protein 19 isoform X5 [Zootermopsis nevadensis]|uniref:disintegrin and metalloproteinase domain-containing protein 19 isoform X5 n=1 Tax=Zootermopsis nevadensis TaxID=136037 RepID=UPI000B8E6FD4|nr:disintegrin and metalloproteinase domain-containing protein 19 isoform X5 [Zootermopsis nevadensis]